jgi:integrase
LRTIVRDYVEAEELPQDAILAFTKARRKLDQEQLIGKSAQRDRLPTPEEIRLLNAEFAKQNDHPRTTTDMVLVVRTELATGRRISEVCRIERQHVNVDKRTCWIYDLKNSKGKGYNAEFALLGERRSVVYSRRATTCPRSRRYRCTRTRRYS